MTQTLPPGLACLDDYEHQAAGLLEPALFAYLGGGSGGEATVRANREAFAAVSLYNRVLRRGGDGSTRLQLLGQSLRHPILLAPIGWQSLVHAEAELATARAAAATDTGMVLSTWATCTLEDVAARQPTPRWLQVYLQPQRADTLALVRRAEAAGYSALVLTLDAPVQALPRAAQRLGFRLPSTLRAANLVQQSPAPARELDSDDSLVFQGAMADAAGDDELAWLLASTRLPVIAKGVSHPGDAGRLRDAGVAGIIVSNHGGRGLDGLPASLAMLPPLRARLGADYPLLLDGGIRSGSDVFKALALGADAVLVGRPQLWALAVAGALGVAHMLKLLREELEVCMAQAGCLELADIDRAAVFQAAPGTGASTCC